MKIDPNKIQELYVRLSPGQGNDGTWSLTIDDEVSGLEVLSFRLDAEMFGELLLNRMVCTQAKFHRSDKLGREQHTKRVMVELLGGHHHSAWGQEALDKSIDACDEVQALLQDGWELDHGWNKWNTHRVNRTETGREYQVLLRKWE